MGRWTGCICILTIVAARGGMTHLVVGVSSVYCRTVEQRVSLARSATCVLLTSAGILERSADAIATRAARNTRQNRGGCLASRVGGEPDERGEQDPSSR